MGSKKNMDWKKAIIWPDLAVRARLLLQLEAIALGPEIIVNLQAKTDIISVIKKVAQNAKQVRSCAKKKEKLHI